MTLSTYATFLTARWDEIEQDQRSDGGEWVPGQWHAADCEQNTYNAGPCDCGVPAHVLADLAAKRAILVSAQSMALLADREKDDLVMSLTAGGMARGIFEAVKSLAAPFRDHPDHPENR